LLYYSISKWGENSSAIGLATNPTLDPADPNFLWTDAGSLLLETTHQFIGPGHAGVLTQGGTNWLSFHYYDGHRRGAATLALRRLEWDTTDWPVVSWTASQVPCGEALLACLGKPAEASLDLDIEPMVSNGNTL